MAQRRVQAFFVVDVFQESLQVFSRTLLVLVSVEVSLLDLYGPPAALHLGVVPRRALTGHALSESRTVQHRQVRHISVVRPLIAVVNQSHHVPA